MGDDLLRPTEPVENNGSGMGAEFLCTVMFLNVLRRAKMAYFRGFCPSLSLSWLTRNEQVSGSSPESGSMLQVSYWHSLLG
jgi:hypothetical protein